MTKEAEIFKSNNRFDYHKLSMKNFITFQFYLEYTV